MHNCKRITNGNGASGWCEEWGLTGASIRHEEGNLADASGWYGNWRSGLSIPERRERDRVVPVMLASKGTPSNIQNERGEEIRTSKSEIRRAGRSGKSFKRRRAGRTEDGIQGGGGGRRAKIGAAVPVRWPPPPPAAAHSRRRRNARAIYTTVRMLENTPRTATYCHISRFATVHPGRNMRSVSRTGTNRSEP